jgi:hypothetical protein
LTRWRRSGRPAGRGSGNTWVKLSERTTRDGGIPLRTQDEQAVIPEEVREVDPESYLRCLGIRGIVDRIEEDPDLDFIIVRPEHATSKDG